MSCPSTVLAYNINIKLMHLGIKLKRKQRGILYQTYAPCHYLLTIANYNSIIIMVYLG